MTLRENTRNVLERRDLGMALEVRKNKGLQGQRREFLLRHTELSECQVQADSLDEAFDSDPRLFSRFQSPFGGDFLVQDPSHDGKFCRSSPVAVAKDRRVNCGQGLSVRHMRM